MGLTSSLTVPSTGPKPIEAKQHGFLTSLLKDFSAGCSILKGLKPIFNYELFLVRLLGCPRGGAGRKGSGWWSWLRDVHTVPTLLGCSESPGSCSRRAQGGTLLAGSASPCRFWLCPCGCRAWGGTAVSPGATAAWVCSSAQGSHSTERHHLQLKLNIFS